MAQLSAIRMNLIIRTHKGCFAFLDFLGFDFDFLTCLTLTIFKWLGMINALHTAVQGYAAILVKVVTKIS